MRNITKVLLVNIALIAVVIVCLELVFGSWLNPAQLNRLNITRNYQRTYDVSALYEWDRKTVTYTRDAFGLRGSYASPGDIDILTVGGSTTDQQFISDGYTWQDVAQDAFARAGTTVVFANAGIDGQSTYGHLKNIDWWYPHIPDLKPSFILYYVGINDFYREDDNYYDGLMRVDHPVKQILQDRSAIYHLVRTLKGAHKASLIDKISHRLIDFDNLDWTDRALIEDHRGLMSRRLEDYAARLEALIDETRLLGATPVLVTQPTRMYRINGGKTTGVAESKEYEGAAYNGVDFYAMMGLLNGVTMTVCRARDAICINLAKDLEPLLEDRDFYDFFHMTPAGERKIGLYLYEQLRPHLS